MQKKQERHLRNFQKDFAKTLRNMNNCRKRCWNARYKSFNYFIAIDKNKQVKTQVFRNSEYFSYFQTLCRLYKIIIQPEKLICQYFFFIRTYTFSCQFVEVFLKFV